MTYKIVSLFGTYNLQNITLYTQHSLYYMAVIMCNWFDCCFIRFKGENRFIWFGVLNKQKRFVIYCLMFS